MGVNKHSPIEGTAAELSQYQEIVPPKHPVQYLFPFGEQGEDIFLLKLAQAGAKLHRSVESQDIHVVTHSLPQFRGRMHNNAEEVNKRRPGTHTGAH